MSWKIRKEPRGSGIASGWQWLLVGRCLQEVFVCPAVTLPSPAIHSQCLRAGRWARQALLCSTAHLFMMEINSSRSRDCPDFRLGVEIDSYPFPERRDLEKPIADLVTTSDFVPGDGLTSSLWQSLAGLLDQKHSLPVHIFSAFAPCVRKAWFFPSCSSCT